MKYVVEQLIKKYSKKEKVVVQMLYKTIEFGYNIEEGFKLINEFYNQK